MTSEYLGNVDYLPCKLISIIPNNAFTLMNSARGFKELEARELGIKRVKKQKKKDVRQFCETVDSVSIIKIL